jgi:hypothetical protein
MHERMTDENDRFDRSGTDEPDGTPAFAASLRAPGESLTTAPNGGDDLAPEPDQAGSASVDGGARYDAAAVSGDTDEYRPE